MNRFFGIPITVKIFGGMIMALAVPTLVLGMYWAPVYDFIDGSLSRAGALTMTDDEPKADESTAKAQTAAEIDRPSVLTKTGAKPAAKPNATPKPAVNPLPQ